MMERQHSRKLIYIPVIHSGSDMGSLEADISRKGIAGLGEVNWKAHVQIVENYWNLIASYCEKQLPETKGLKIFQDGMVADGEIAKQIIRDNAKMGSRNYKIIAKLMGRGAVIVKTENIDLVLKELDLYKSVSASGSLISRIIRIALTKFRRKRLMIRRDAYIAAQIRKSLKHGETGLLFLGAYHSILNKLPADIHVTQLKEISKVRDYQKLLILQSKKKLQFQKLANYLITP